MGTTANRLYPYPASTAAPNVPSDIAALANAVDADMESALATEVPVLINQSSLTADGSALSGSTEAQQTTVTISAVSGKRYEIRFFAHISSATAADSYQLKVREDAGIAGTQIGLAQVYASTTSTVGYAAYSFCQYTALATASKTFSLTIQRNGSAGTGQLRAGVNRPSWIQVWLVP